jgi:hypothetical protein
MIFLYEKKKPDFFSSSKTSSKCIFVVDLFFPFFVLLLLSSLVSFSLPQQHQLTQCWGRKKYKIFEKKISCGCCCYGWMKKNMKELVPFILRRCPFFFNIISNGFSSSF